MKAVVVAFYVRRCVLNLGSLSEGIKCSKCHYAARLMKKNIPESSISVLGRDVNIINLLQNFILTK